MGSPGNWGCSDVLETCGNRFGSLDVGLAMEVPRVAERAGAW